MNTRILQIRKTLENSKSSIIFFDVDTDGCTSYLQIKKTFPQSIGFPMGKDFKKQQSLINYIKPGTDLILFIDTPIISDELLDKLENKTIMWVDHHPNDNVEQINKYNIIYFNPTTEYRINLPCAYLAYKICNDKQNIPKAALGSISDFFLQDIIIDFYKYDKKKFKVLLDIPDERRTEIFNFITTNIENHTIPSGEERDNYIRYLTYETNINLVRNFIETILKLKEDEDTIKAIREIEKLTIPEMIQNINSEKGYLYEEFAKTRKLYRDTLNKALKQKYDENLFFFSYIGERGFAGALSQEINYRTKSKVVGIAYKKKDKDYYTCSLRGRNYNVLELLQYSMKGLKASGGGHKFATGSAIHKSDFAIFKQRIIEKTSMNQANVS